LTCKTAARLVVVAATYSHRAENSLALACAFRARGATFVFVRILVSELLKVKADSPCDHGTLKKSTNVLRGKLAKITKALEIHAGLFRKWGILTFLKINVSSDSCQRLPEN